MPKKADAILDLIEAFNQEKGALRTRNLRLFKG
jgi:hypothetical protein